MKLKIERICDSCNKPFVLKDIEHNGVIRASVANFEDCPHCGKRNDHWISVSWPQVVADDYTKPCEVPVGLKIGGDSE